jgi:tRNA (guanine-N7-)-methyltransferase
MVVRPDILNRLQFAALFGNPNPVELELGAGDGSFIVRYAQANPDRNFLAVERLLGRLRKIERKAGSARLLNLRGTRIEASYLVEWMIPPSSLAALHIYFPDPWPKRRHWKHRLIQPSFMPVVHRALAPGGILHLRTDHTEYFEQMQRVLASASGFETFAPPPDLLAIETDFEREFHARGIPTQSASYIKRVAPDACVVPPGSPR